ncbi:MAG: dehydrogenase [Mesorhizobium amorphae]|nr:MAG: dehydrogenase [Mesorhizobium amorphae]
MSGIAPAEIERVALQALVRAGASGENAAPVARAIARAEAEGNPVCGLFYLPIFCAQLRSGKLDGVVSPVAERQGSAVRVDARSGFAHPAIEAGLPLLIAAARENGVAAMALRRSTNCLALGHHVRPLAESGLFGICMANAPASVAPPGATARLFGTNPLAFAIPCGAEPPIVVDQSLSAATKTAVLMRRDRGEAIPLGWGQDGAGRPTTDPAEALAGSLLPAGGQKGANLMLLVEVLAAVLSGSSLSTEASGFGDDQGPAPDTGQFLLAIDPGHFAGEAVAPALARLAERFTDAAVRLPGRGEGRTQVPPDPALWARALALAGQDAG